MSEQSFVVVVVAAAIVVVATLLFLTLYPSQELHHPGPLTGNFADGTQFTIPDVDEDIWFGHCCRAARQSGRTIVVTQDRRLVCIIEP